LSDPESNPVRRWSTADVEPTRRLAYFAAALSEAVMPMGVDQVRPDAFAFELSSAPLGEIAVTRAQGAAHASFRGRAELARSADHSFSLLMSLHKPWSADHRGAIRMAPRDVLVIDSDYPLRMEVHSAFDAVNVSVSEAWLRRWIADPHLLATRRIPGDSLWGATLSSYLSALSPELAASPPLPLAVMSDQVGSLLALTAAGVQGARPTRGTGGRALHLRIVDCIRQRCTEPGLTAPDIAASLQISLRTLHRALAAQQETFGARLIHARAETGLRMLRSPLFKRTTIEQIGHRAGFPSASHFAQVIRAHTGLTPRRIRRDALDGR